MDIAPSTRPLEAISNVNALVSLRDQVKTGEDLRQWLQLTDREMQSLAQFTKEGAARLQRSSDIRQNGQTADERKTAEAEIAHIKNLLGQLNVATDKLSAARRKPVSLVPVLPTDPVVKVSSTPYQRRLAIRAVVFFIFIAGAAVFEGWSKLPSQTMSQPAFSTHVSITPSPAAQTIPNIARSVFGIDLRSAVLDGDTARIEYECNGYSNSSIIVLAGLKLKETAPKIFSIPNVKWLVLDATTDWVDTYGNTRRATAIKFTINYRTASVIKWENFDPANLIKVLSREDNDDTVVTHPSLLNDWAAYEGY